MDELLFLHRNKLYGAYQLRKLYSRNMCIGLGISILIYLILIIVPSINWENESEYKMTEVEFDYKYLDMVPPKVQSKPSIPAEQESKVKTKSEKLVKTDDQPKIVKDDQPEPVKTQSKDQVDSTLKETSDKQTNKDSLKGIGNIEGEGNLPFDFVDVMPQFPGGQGALKRFLSAKSVYPASAVQNKIEGEVYVGFVIDKNGKVRNPKILKSLYPACDEEALRVVKLMPDWIPAKNQGRIVSINFKIPIEFKLIR